MTVSLWIGDHAVLAGSDPWQGTARSHHAPLFPGDAHPRQNLHQATLSDWRAFAHATSLDELFFAPDGGLMAAFPHTTRVTRELWRAIEAAMLRYLDAHRSVDPDFAGDREDARHLARLLWLDAWGYWARHHFQDPAIHVR